MNSATEGQGAHRAQTLSFASPDTGEELERAELYGLLSRLWLAPPDATLLAQFAVAVTKTDQGGTFLEEPWQAMVAALRAGDAARIKTEFESLFYSAGKAEVLPYSSFHIAGVLNERPLVDLRTDIAALGLASHAAEGETEDHVAFILEVMRYLIAGDDIAICNLEQQRKFFRKHVQTWVGTGLCEHLEALPRAKVYATVARFTRAFIEVETQAFDMIE